MSYINPVYLKGLNHVPTVTHLGTIEIIIYAFICAGAVYWIIFYLPKIVRERAEAQMEFLYGKKWKKRHQDPKG